MVASLGSFKKLGRPVLVIVYRMHKTNQHNVLNYHGIDLVVCIARLVVRIALY